MTRCPSCNGKGMLDDGWPIPTIVCSRCHGKGEIMSDTVNHPSHYNIGNIEVIDAIEDWKLGFNDGNAVKYISRHKHKGAPQQDLEKALWYVARELVSIYGVHQEKLAAMIMVINEKKEHRKGA